MPTKSRLKLDLSEFFSDARRLSFVLIDWSSWKTVSDLEEHVQKIFGLESNVRFTTEDNCFLPSLESIDVLDLDKLLKVITLDENCSSRRKETSPSQNNDYKEYKELKKLKKRKYKSIEEENTVSDQIEQASSIVEKPEEEKAIPDTTIPSDESSRKKRKRVRKKKTTAKGIIEDEGTCTAVERIEPVIILENFVETLSTDKPRIIRDVNFKENGRKDERNKIEIIQDILVTPNGHAIDVTCGKNANPSLPDNPVHELTAAKSNAKGTDDEGFNVTNGNENEFDTAMSEVSAGEPTREGSDGGFNVADLLKLSQPLENRPAIGDIVLFQLNRSGDEFIESLSEYICGKCEEESDDGLHLLIIGGREHIIESCKTYFVRNPRDGLSGAVSVLKTSIDCMLNKRIFEYKM